MHWQVWVFGRSDILDLPSDRLSIWNFYMDRLSCYTPPPPPSLSHWSLMVAFTRLSQPHHHCCHPDLNPPPWLSPILGLFAPLLRPDPAPTPDPWRQISQWWFWCWRPNGCGWVLPGGDMWKVPQEAPRLIKVWYLHRPVLTILPGN